MGFFSVPPAYPTRVRITPRKLPNRESGPQNQPSANVAVLVGVEISICGVAASVTALFSVSSIVFLSFAEPQAATPQTSITMNALVTAILWAGVAALMESVIDHTSLAVRANHKTHHRPRLRAAGDLLEPCASEHGGQAVEGEEVGRAGLLRFDRVALHNPAPAIPHVIQRSLQQSPRNPSASV